MLDRLLATDTFAAARDALDGLAARHAAIADNIANVNTPGYKRKDVPFEEALARLTEEGGLQAPFQPPVVRDTLSGGRADGNNVDVEREAVMLSENALRFEAVSQYVGGYFAGLKLVINGGR